MGLSLRASALVACAFTGSAAPPIVTVTGLDYAFTAPDTLPSGPTTFRFVDKGKVVHHLIVFRLDPDISMSEFHKLMSGGGASPRGIRSLGGLQSNKIYAERNNPDPAAKQRSRELTIDLAPGRYVLACLHAEDGVSHLQKGMMRPLTVIASKSKAPLPQVDATLEMSDYKYELSTPLKAGRRTLRIINSGPQEHHVFIQRMRPGKTIADINLHRAARARERAAGQPEAGVARVPPMTPVAETTRMSPGEVVFITLDLVHGDYRLFCLVGDANDKRTHAEHGMDQLITVR